MADRKVGSVVYWHGLSPILSVFRMMPEEGSPFPDYKPGQYIALRRDDCMLTKKITGQDGKTEYVYDLDESGNPKRGPVTHSYSISSAPCETQQHGYLEFYIILEKGDRGQPGRLTESIFRIAPQVDDKVVYVNRITGDFTLDKRSAGYDNVLLVGTGTGLAPFAAMIKQIHHDVANGRGAGTRYTLLHTNRIYEELGYHEELMAIEKEQRFDFLYVPSVSRPTQRDLNDPLIGKGRANNMLRHIFEMPLKEEQELAEKNASGEDASAAKAALAKTVMPVLPDRLSRKAVIDRLSPADRTVILTCGNPNSMADIKYIADSNQIRFEKEDW